MQDTASPSTNLLFSIVDLHAITLPLPKGALTQFKHQGLASLLAIGLDPARSTIFYQSSVPAHSELQWILSCLAPTGYLSRMTQWKSKLKLGEDASVFDEDKRAKLRHGLFSYPILQAADVLVHRATHVPVAPVKRVMSLRTPTAKMSKSDPDLRGRILLNDGDEVIRKKVMGAVTDSVNAVSCDPKGRPGVANLLGLLSYFTGEVQSTEELAREMEGRELSVLKRRVADVIVEYIGPIRERYEEIMGRGQGYLDGIAEHGKIKANESAEATMKLVREAVELS
ncbi:hypothetical protein OQA88_124 [Cercophora sp. LCS_1]